MEQRNSSRTAFMTAYLRGYHAVNDSPKIIDDEIAWRLVPAEVRNGIEQHLINSALEMAPEHTGKNLDNAAVLKLGVHTMAGSILARARYVENRLAEAMQKGARQYVILGAGLDTFAYRRQDPKDYIKVYEIDLASTQHIKKQLLAGAGLPIPDYLRFLPIDFTRESLFSVLSGSDFSQDQPSLFSWTGVTHYLPVEAIHATLKDVSNIACRGSEIVFDYWDKTAFDPDESSNRVKTLIKNTQRIGEPIITGLDPLTLGQELANLGLRLLEDLDKTAIHQRYFKNNPQYSASDHVHFACAAIQ